MGSGRGKMRRTQSGVVDATVSARLPSTMPPTVSLCEGNWHKFVRDSGLEKVKVEDYYLKDVSFVLGGLDYDKLFNDLFLDAVTVSALTLPSPYTVDDFEFGVAVDPGRTVIVSLKDDPCLPEVMYGLGAYVNVRAAMSSKMVFWVLQEYARVIQALLVKDAHM